MTNALGEQREAHSDASAAAAVPAPPPRLNVPDEKRMPTVPETMAPLTGLMAAHPVHILPVSSR
jgi:hypothetical protein